MLTIKTNFVLLFVLLLSVCGWCQQPEQYFYTHYKITDGLASNVVNNMVQDSEGFLWLSTNNGLQRFDGNKFITFKSNVDNPRSLPSDEVTQVYQDRNKNLWVTTLDNKVGLFSTKSFTYTEVPIRQWSREKVHVEKTFLETNDGKLLVHFRKSDKLFQYDPAAKAFVPSTAIPFANGWNVNYMIQDKLSRKVYMATDSGLVVYNQKTGRLSYGNNNPEADPVLTSLGAERYINYLFLDSDRRLFVEQWIKTNRFPFLHVINMNNGEKRRFDLQKDEGLGYHQFKGFLQQQNGRLWIYGLPFLLEYENSSNPLHFVKKDYNKEKDPKFNIVYSVFEDRQHNLWICSDYGLYLFNPDAQLFHNYTLTTPKRFTVEGRAQCALQMPNGEVWVGYRDLGLFRYTSQMRPLQLPATILPLQEGKSVWYIHLHSKTGKIWIAMQGGNLIVYDTANQQARLISPPPFEGRAITQIAEDKFGNLWLGTQGGNVVKWDLASGSKKEEDGFSLVKKTGIVERIFTDKPGHVWVAAVGEGLLKIDPATSQVVQQIFETSPKGYNLWSNNPRDLIQYNDSLLVVASGALNVLNLNTGAIRQISHYNGLPSNTVQTLAKDASGMLWLGTMNGLCRADLAKLSFTVYDQRDGLLNEGFNIAGANRLNDGRLLFTAAESFLIFNPTSMARKDSFNKAIITDFKLMNRSLRVDSLLAQKQINLNYDNTNLVIEFSALNYSKLSKLDYYYQLQNFDTTWVKSDDRHQAVYTFLPPGNYTFRVRTKDLEGHFSPQTVTMRIYVSPPFWKTWWFFTLIALCVILVLYLLDRERIKRLVSLQNVRSDIASQLHQEVSTTLNNINVLSQIAKLKAEKDVVRSKELIDEISGKSYNMMVSMDEILWSIDPTNDTMEKTILRLLEFAKTLESAYGAAIDIVVHDKVKDLRLSMKVRHDFFIACKEALQYLARYSREKNIMVDIELAWSKIIVKILSVGAETDVASLNIIELRKIMNEKAASMQANLTFEIGKRDTSIVLAIPVK